MIIYKLMFLIFMQWATLFVSDVSTQKQKKKELEFAEMPSGLKHSWPGTADLHARIIFCILVEVAAVGQAEERLKAWR
jgi:hypothetical protein